MKKGQLSDWLNNWLGILALGGSPFYGRGISLCNIPDRRTSLSDAMNESPANTRANAAFPAPVFYHLQVPGGFVIGFGEALDILEVLNCHDDTCASANWLFCGGFISRYACKIGPRQNYDFLDPYFRQHAERIIREIVSLFKDHPAVIGYQIDNETFPAGVPTEYMNAAFLERLKQEYKTPQTLNRIWGLTYVGPTSEQLG
jgi:glycosyl hydrolase family 42 (putative beta-galactosidase)